MRHPGAKASVLIALALLAAATAACGRGRGAGRVTAIRVAEGALSEPLREAGMDAAALDAAAREGIEAAGFKVGPGEDGHVARVDVRSVRLAAPEGREGGLPRVEVAVELELAPARPGSGARGPGPASGIAAVPLGSGAPTGAWRAAVSQACRRAAEGLALALAEEAKPLEALIEDLAASDARVREQAARVLADRRSAAAVPALIARLSDPEPEVVHRAIGALAQIGDPRAVGPLIDASQRGDPGLTARLARMIGDIGGDEARGYLLTIEAGHEDPRVRRAAREALDDMSQRATQPKVADGKRPAAR